MVVAIGLALVTASMSACANYHPRPSRFIYRDPAGNLHRDGQDFKVSMFGDSTESLVSGNPRALEYARRYKNLNHIGLPIYLVGLAAMLASPFVAAAVPERAQTATAFGGLGLGFGISLVGIALMFKGDAALVDAVNVYNDDLADPSRAGRP